MLSQKTVSMANNSERNLIQKLKSNNASNVRGALLHIRKYYLRDMCKMKRLQKHSVIELILPFLEQPKFRNVSLSIIADVCVEFIFVQEVIKFNGEKSLLRIMKSFVNEGFQNRACRALGNMAKFKVGLEAVNHMKPVSIIINFLNKTHDANCQQTALRTLMVLGISPKARELIIQKNGIISVAKLLHSPKENVLICSIKALANLTENCSIVCAQQLLEFEFLKVIVDLHSHSEKSIQDHAFISLINLSTLEIIRADLVRVGAVKLFTDVLSKLDSLELGRLAALALCNCLDHIHMWSYNGTDKAVSLKSLLDVLQNKKFQDIHAHVISSFVPLLNDSELTDILLNLNFLEIIINLFKSFIENHKCQTVASFLLKSQSILPNVEREKNFEVEISQCNFHMTDNLPDVNYVPREESDEICKEFVIKNKMFLKQFSETYGTKLENSCNSSKTNDYSSSYSPNRMFSPVKQLSTSDLDLDSAPGHSSGGTRSPQSATGEFASPRATCWSPVGSSNLKSLSPEIDNVLDESNSNKVGQLPSSSIKCNSDKTGNFQEITSSVDGIISTSSETNIAHIETLNQNIKGEKYLNLKSDFMESPNSRKRLKTENLNTDEYDKASQDLTDGDKIKLMNNDTENNSDKKDLNFQQSSEYVVKCSLDDSILNLIQQLYYNLQEMPNCPLADKACFTVLMDYICFLHEHNLKIESILIFLIQNRYFFEKNVLNGFVMEMADRMATYNYSCVHQHYIEHFYLIFIERGRKEAESDHGIGTLSHILVASEKESKLLAVCAMTKLVTEKSALYRLLFQANGMSLLFTFLTDNCIITRRKAIVALCELYQSLTKDQKREKCCFVGTSGLRTSKICFYKNAFLNVTFSLDSGVQILANREKLSENSEYFRALLSGHFLEANAERVSLSDISANNLSIIFHFLHGCGSSAYCRYIKGLSLSVLLELLSSCDRFLLINIKTFIEDQLCHRLFPATIANIYTKSKMYNSPALTKKVLHFALSKSTEQKEILWSCFEELIHLENFNILGDIENLLMSLF